MPLNFGFGSSLKLFRLPVDIVAKVLSPLKNVVLFFVPVPILSMGTMPVSKFAFILAFVIFLLLSQLHEHSAAS